MHCCPMLLSGSMIPQMMYYNDQLCACLAMVVLNWGLTELDRIPVSSVRVLIALLGNLT